MNFIPVSPLRSAALAAVILAGFSFAAAQDSPSATHQLEAWVGARVIDGTGKPAIENATLLVRNGRIEAVGKHVKIPAGAQRIDATGKTIIPGVVHPHGHQNDPAPLGVYLPHGLPTCVNL